MHVSYWLMPRDEDAAVVRKAIEQLAGRFDAPPFSPHVTLYSGDVREMDAESIVREVGRCFGAQTLKTGAVGQTGRISKTLFLEFEDAPSLAAMAERIRVASASGGYVFDPHLSLLYKALEPGIREALARETRVPLEEIRFDRVAAVLTGGRSLGKAGVAKWKTLAHALLTGKG